MNRSAAFLAVLACATAPLPAHARVPPPILASAPDLDEELGEDDQERVDQLLDGLRNAEDAAGKDAATGLAMLNRMLENIEGEPALSGRTDKLSEDRTFVALTIAAALLDKGDESNASRLLDYVIRASHGKDAPIASYSKALRDLYEECARDPELAPIGSVAITCNEPCRVVLDERSLGGPDGGRVEELPLGEHRLYVESVSGDTEPYRELLLLSGSDIEFDLQFGTARNSADEPSDYERKLPRWAGITGIVVGAVAVIAGATLLALDETCPDGSDPAGPDACDNVFDTLGVGAGITAAGAATLVGFSVALAIGETRARKAGDGSGTEASVTVGYTFRF